MGPGVLGFVLAAGLLAACGAVRQDGLGTGGNTAAGPPDDAGATPAPPDGAPAPGTPPIDPASPPGPAAGLELRRARFVEGFEESDWQCTASLCLRGRDYAMSPKGQQQEGQRPRSQRPRGPHPRSQHARSRRPERSAP